MLEKREWTSKTTGATGNTYCFNNQNPDRVDFCGHSVSVSILTNDTKTQAPRVFAWVNEMTDAQYEAFIEEYGDSVYLHVPTKQMLTKKEYDELGIEDSAQSTQVGAQF